MARKLTPLRIANAIMALSDRVLAKEPATDQHSVHAFFGRDIKALFNHAYGRSTTRACQRGPGDRVMITRKGKGGYEASW